MNAHALQNLFCVRKQSWRNKNEPERNLWRAQAGFQVLRPALQSLFVEAAVPMGRYGEFIFHRGNLTTTRAKAIPKRKRPSGSCGKGVAGAAGLEPVTSAVTGQRSNQLSYAPAWDT